MNEQYSCIIIDDEPLAVDLLTVQLSQLYKNISILKSCNHWQDALNSIRQLNADFIFMDISMPEKNGIDLLKLIPDIKSEIIFITAHDEFALQAFNFNTSGYLLKPVSDAELLKAIDRAIGRIQHKQHGKEITSVKKPFQGRIGIPGIHGIEYVEVKDILYLESVNKCTKVVTAKKEYTSLSPLIKFKALEETHPFLQVHRSFIVNLRAIVRFDANEILIMTNGYEIPLARTFKGDFLTLFSNTF